MKPVFIFSAERNSRSSKANDLDSFTSSRWETLYAERCPFCKTDCTTGQVETAIMDAPGEFQVDRLSICHRCGWWSYENEDPNPYCVYHWSSCAVLKRFSVDAPDAPVEELAKYIETHYDAVSQVSPPKFEELVGYVFSSYFGYKVEYCSYGRPDLGIDLVVVNTDQAKPTAIQVKRYKKPIELGQIHEFFGAMVDSQYKKGIFVTSGRFRKGAKEAAGRLNTRADLEIDLVDGKRMLEFLQVANSKGKPTYDSVEELLKSEIGRVQTKWILDSLRQRGG